MQYVAKAIWQRRNERLQLLQGQQQQQEYLFNSSMRALKQRRARKQRPMRVTQ